MEYAPGAPSEPPPRGMITQQPGHPTTTYKAAYKHNYQSMVTTAHPFGAIGQEVKAASHTSTTSTCCSDDRDGESVSAASGELRAQADDSSVPLDAFTDSRERAGSLRELVEQSTPIDSIAFASPAERLDYTPSRQQQRSPTNSREILELYLRSPAWTPYTYPQSAPQTFEALPLQAINPFGSAIFNAPPPPDALRMSPQSNFQRPQTTGNANTYIEINHHALPPPMQVPPQFSTLPQNPSPERNIMGYRELVHGINADLEIICREHVTITKTTDSQADQALFDLVVSHMGTHEAASYILKRTDLHIALVMGLVWRQVSTYILSKPVLDKAPARSAAAYHRAWMAETFAEAHDTDNMVLRQTLAQQRSSLVADIQRAPEYQAFMKTFGSQVASDVVRNLWPVWRIGRSYEVSPRLAEKVITKLVRVISRMRSEAKVFHFDFSGFGTPFSGLCMSKRNPDLLLEHGNDGTYAVMCNIAPAVYEMDFDAGRLDTKVTYLAEVLVYDQSKHFNEALNLVKLYRESSPNKRRR